MLAPLTPQPPQLQQLTNQSSCVGPPPLRRKPTYLHTHLNKWVQTLSRSDDQGHLYQNANNSDGTRAVGSQAKKNRVSADPGSLAFKAAMKEFGGSKPVYMIPSPEDRALAIKLHGTKAWTESEKKIAAREFTIPRGTKVLLVHPELFDRHICSLNLRWKKGINGVLMPCPHCNSNKYVTHDSWSVNGHNDPRSIATNDNSVKMFVVGPVYQCTNPACVKS
jgi:hypothetical protein